MKYEFKVDEQNNNIKLGVFLRKCGISCSLVRSVKYREDGIEVDGVRAKTNRLLCEGQTVQINLPNTENNILSLCDADVGIAYESENVIVYDKPAGMATHPTLGQKDGTLANVYAALLCSRGVNDAFRPTNRLDKNTSGLVLAAKSRYAAAQLSKSSDKFYLAIAEGIIEDCGVIDEPIGRDPNSIIKRCVSAEGQPSITEYEVLKQLKAHTIIKVHTLTGRTHQIRVHMSWIGHPLAGDTLYGGDGTLINRHALHCGELVFSEPVSDERVTVRSALPADMEELIAKLGG
ncbi:MAG: RluA family pseudouridine synthase [Oscillospiraceae bacterium]